VSDRSNPDDDEPIFRLVVLDRGDYANVYGADPPTRPCRACRGRPLPPGPGGAGPALDVTPPGAGRWMSRCSPSTRLRGSWPSRPNSGPNGGCPFRGAGIPEFSDGEKKGVGRVDPQGPPFSRMVRREHPRLCWRPTIPGISPSRRVAPHRDRPATFIAKNYDAQAAIGDHALMIPRHPSPRAPPVGSQSARRSQSNRGACRRPAPSGPGASSELGCPQGLGLPAPTPPWPPNPCRSKPIHAPASSRGAVP